MYVCPLPFSSWKEHAMNKVMKHNFKEAYGEKKMNLRKKIKVVRNCMKWRKNLS